MLYTDIIDKNYRMYIGIVKCQISQICNRVTALDLCQNLVFAQYLENENTDEAKLCIHIIIDKIYVGIVHCHFSQKHLRPLIATK